MQYSYGNPWIAEREATICTWKADYNRGFISNMASSLPVDFISMSDRQLGEYAKILKVCGFTGIHVTDMVSAWRTSGSWEIVHDRYKVPPKARYRELNSAMESRKAYNTL